MTCAVRIRDAPDQSRGSAGACRFFDREYLIAYRTEEDALRPWFVADLTLGYGMDEPRGFYRQSDRCRADTPPNAPAL